MLWNKPEELAFYLNKYIQYNQFNTWINRLFNPRDEREKIINIELMKSIKKCICYLNLSEQKQKDLLININNFIKIKK